jgi:dihydroorotate dehydrogenase electron transfer subunit
MFLAEKLQSHNDTMTQRHKVIVLLGSKTKKDILCEKEFKSLGCEVKVATDDGSKGHKSFVTDLLSGILRSSQYAVRSTIYACGPKPMLKETARIAARHKIPCQVLLEEYMACGVGVCLGCAVKVRTQYSILNTQYQYKMVCKDGPVFDGGEVVWE